MSKTRTALLSALALSLAPFGPSFAAETADQKVAAPASSATTPDSISGGKPSSKGFYDNMVGAGGVSPVQPAKSGNALPAPTYNTALPAPTYNSALPAPTYSSDNQETEEHEHGTGGHGDDKGGGKKAPLSQTIQATTQNAMQQQTSPQ